MTTWVDLLGQRRLLGPQQYAKQQLRATEGQPKPPKCHCCSYVWGPAIAGILNIEPSDGSPIRSGVRPVLLTSTDAKVIPSTSTVLPNRGLWVPRDRQLSPKVYEYEPFGLLDVQDITQPVKVLRYGGARSQIPHLQFTFGVLYHHVWALGLSGYRASFCTWYSFCVPVISAILRVLLNCFASWLLLNPHRPRPQIMSTWPKPYQYFPIMCHLV